MYLLNNPSEKTFFNGILLICQRKEFIKTFFANQNIYTKHENKKSKRT